MTSDQNKSPDGPELGAVTCSAWWETGWSRFVRSFEPTWTGSWKFHQGIHRRNRYKPNVQGQQPATDDDHEN